METRRILRLERRRAHRTAVLAVVCAVLGVGLGMLLPRSTIASVALLASAAVCLAAVALHAESFAPLHGLHRVVRLPFLRSISATFASFRARVVGSMRALRHRRPAPSPIVLDELDELDEDAAAWWGTSAARPSAPSVPAPAASAPSAPVPPAPAPLAPIPPMPAPYAPVDAASLSPVLAAPLPSARVSVSVTHRVRARVAQVRDGARQHVKAVTTKTRVRA